MNTSLDPALVGRLSGEFRTLADRMNTLGGDLALLRDQLVDAGEPSAVATPPSGVPVGAWSARPGATSEQDESPVSARVPAGAEPASAATTGGGAGSPGAADTGSGPGVVPEPRPLWGAPPTGVPAAASGVMPVPMTGPWGGRGPESHGLTGGAGAGREARDTGAFAGGVSGRGAGVPAGAGPAGAGSPWSRPLAPAPAPGRPPGPAGQAPPMPGAPWPQAGMAQPVRAGGYWAPPGQGRYAPAPKVRTGPTVPWWQREGVISRVLAVAGVGVTLIGVVMLLVLAAQAGFFGPVPRVVTGVAFSAGLVAAGWRVFGRPGGRTGGIALAATGIAGLYLAVVAVSGFYRWVPVSAGLAGALVVAGAGVGLALRWRSQPLAVLVVLGAAVLSPAITTELALLGFLLVLQGSGLAVQLRRDWPVLHVTRTLPIVLATLVFAASAAITDETLDHRRLVLAVAVASAALGLGGALLVTRVRPGDVTATVTMVLSAAPLSAAALLFERPWSVAVAAGAAVAYLLVGAAGLRSVPAVPQPVPVEPGARPDGGSANGTGSFAAPGFFGVPVHLAAGAALVGAVAVFQSCVDGARGSWLPATLFAVSAAYFTVAAARRSAAATVFGGAFALLGGLTLLDAASPETLAVRARAAEALTGTTLLAAVLGLVATATAVWAVHALPGRDATLRALIWVVAGVADLYLVLVAAVSIGIASGAADGFVLGHSAATITWMAAATGSLLYGLRNLVRAPGVAKVCLVSGLGVAVAATAKLFLFDLATLSGLVRVAAFLVVGVLLLLAGTRYARAFADTAGPGSPRG